MRYRLDDLGWHQFETLIQAILKAELGLSVQSWGGTADLGRDAYTRKPLRFPDRAQESQGPFLFQAKFVQSANATGAVWRPSLLRAISAEQSRIEERRGQRKWEEPAHYVLLTNCPLTASVREEVNSMLRSAVPAAQVTTLGGGDICDLLDKNTALRQSYPEILSLRDLNLLLRDAVNADILQRSKAAIQETRDLVPVFVATSAYRQARRILKRNNFVVLDGPPEMGKTAIAQTLALGLLFKEWQVVECRHPNDFFSAYTEDRRQVFVADDAFGRTEFDPTLGRAWERDLPKALLRLNQRHRLIWTTRKHILVRALRDMDLTGLAARFPKPGEVAVTADALTVEEKARILYRHCRAAKLGDEARHVVRKQAVSIVSNRHFTPERIRRFASDVLPKINVVELTRQDGIGALIAEELQNPTERMRKSYQKLSGAHRSVLTAMLDTRQYMPSVDALRSTAKSLCEDLTDGTFDDCVDDLDGTFVKGHQILGRQYIDWIHPSYRDLVIDQLSSSDHERRSYLRLMSLGGVSLAFSVAGGGAGERQLPLLRDRIDWQIARARCRAIAESEANDVVAQLVEVLGSASKALGAPGHGAHVEIQSMLREACEVICARWGKCDMSAETPTLIAVHRVMQALSDPPSLLNAYSTWSRLTELLQTRFAEGTGLERDLDRWAELKAIVQKCYADPGEVLEIERKSKELIDVVLKVSEREVSDGPDIADPESNLAVGRRLEERADFLASFEGTERVVADLLGLAEVYRENGPTARDEDDHEAGEDNSSETFDVEAFFSDL